MTVEFWSSEVTDLRKSRCDWDSPRNLKFILAKRRHLPFHPLFLLPYPLMHQLLGRVLSLWGSPREQRNGSEVALDGPRIRQSLKRRSPRQFWCSPTYSSGVCTWSVVKSAQVLFYFHFIVLIVHRVCLSFPPRGLQPLSKYRQEISVSWVTC